PLVFPGRLEFCDAEQIARAHISAFHYGRTAEHYVLGGKFTSWLELFQKICYTIGTKPPKRSTPKMLLYIVALLEGIKSIIYRSPSLLTLDLINLLSGSNRIPFNERYKSEKELNYYSNNTNLDKTIKDIYDWMKLEKII